MSDMRDSLGEGYNHVWSFLALKSTKRKKPKTNELKKASFFLFDINKINNNQRTTRRLIPLIPRRQIKCNSLNIKMK